MAFWMLLLFMTLLAVGVTLRFTRTQTLPRCCIQASASASLTHATQNEQEQRELAGSPPDASLSIQKRDL